MKSTLKIWVYMFAIVFAAGLIFLARMFVIARAQRDEINSTTHVVIELKENIPELNIVELHMCAEIHSFKLQTIKDTVSENITVPYKEFPCKTFFRYVFSSGKSTEIATEDFNCAGCSSTHVYTLSRDSVQYKYLP